MIIAALRAVDNTIADSMAMIIRYSDSEFLVSILQIAHLWANTGVVFRELSFSRLECGVHDRLHTPCVGSFTYPGIDTR